jgi:tRNA modification GTPase
MTRLPTMMINTDTIAAIATPPGRGGIGIIRVSGPKTISIATALIGKLPTPRYAQQAAFHDNDNQIIDEGIALYFEGPHSFTGEDVIEFHAHGGPIILDNLLQRILSLGARMAKPGEFSERAFLNDKIDLVQAEAIADLIDSASQQAARAAIRSLQGEFSTRIHDLINALISLRMYVEAAIDFPEEEIDFLSDGKVENTLDNIITRLTQVKRSAHQGALLREGLTVVIAGRPNAGKSSLLNRLSGRETAIVTDIPGTTRDILREHIHLDGIPLHILDTAGLRDSSDSVEKEGIRRAWEEIHKADHILLVVDASQLLSAHQKPLEESEIENELAHEHLLIKQLPTSIPLTVVKNKIDLTNELPHLFKHEGLTEITVSAKMDQGIDLLKQHLKECVGFNCSPQEGLFSARRRHLDALDRAHGALLNGQHQLKTHRAGELLAEELRLAHIG